ncbi:hypothetical protein D3C81_1512900 [compost metagenome]
MQRHDNRRGGMAAVATIRMGRRHRYRRGVNLGQRLARLRKLIGRRLGTAHHGDGRREAFAPGQHQADGGFERLGGAGFRQQAAHGLREAEFGHGCRHVFGQHQHALRLQPLAQAGKAEPAGFRIGGQAIDQQIGVVRPRIRFMQGLGIDIDQIAGNMRLCQQVAQPKA